MRLQKIALAALFSVSATVAFAQGMDNKSVPARTEVHAFPSLTITDTQFLNGDSNGKPVTGKDLRAAIVAALSGEMVDQVQRPSIGCNIKWIENQAPVYFTGVRAEDE